MSVRRPIRAKLDMTHTGCEGFTLIELMIVTLVLGVLAMIAVPNLRSPVDQLHDGAFQLAGLLKQARAKAIATTSAYKVAPSSSTRLTTTLANTCTATTPEADSTLLLDLSQGVSLADTTWSVCFSPRGRADQNLTITLQGAGGRTKNVEVFLGGAVRRQP